MKQLVFLLLIVILVPSGVFWHYERAADEALLKAVFKNPDGRVTERFRLEIASRPGERQMGLMYRKSLDENHGMIFVFPAAEDQQFHMKNTLVSLDMIFIDEAGKVVGVLENLPVMNEEKRGVGVPSLWVVELAAGTAKREGIVVGSTFTPEGPVPRGVS